MTVQNPAFPALSARLVFVAALQVALKVLDADTASNQDFSEKFFKELELLKKLTDECEHVCRFHGVSEIDGRYCLVMKLYARSLAAELREVKATGEFQGVLSNAKLSAHCFRPYQPCNPHCCVA